jgi:hypothetical protein
MYVTLQHTGVGGVGQAPREVCPVQRERDLRGRENWYNSHVFGTISFKTFLNVSCTKPAEPHCK